MQVIVISIPPSMLQLAKFPEVCATIADTILWDAIVNSANHTFTITQSEILETPTSVKVGVIGEEGY